MTSKHQIEAAERERCAKLVEGYRYAGRDNTATGVKIVFVEGRDAMTTALAALVRGLPPQGEDGVVVPLATLRHWLEYWNGSQNERAMSDALSYLMEEFEATISAAQSGEDQRAGTVCPDFEKMGEFACKDWSQCFEPCGRLGHSEAHAVVSQPPAHQTAAPTAREAGE